LPTELRLVVKSELGLHARPAAAFVQAAARLSARGGVHNLTTGKGPASARSLLALLSLGVRQGHEVRLVAEGEQESETVLALAELLGGKDAELEKGLDQFQGAGA